jgi:RNA polymerase sigma-70 factor, ECF subfamily
MISRKEFNGIYRQHADAVFCVCLRSVTRREIAEEIASEVFLTLYQSVDSVTRDQAPAWLFTVAKRRAADYWSRWYLEQRWSDGDVPSEPQTRIQSRIPEYSLDDLLSRCSNLKPIHRVCIILRFAHGLSRSEIATQTGLSEFQVKGHLQYALTVLRDTLTVHRTQLPPAGDLR